jgi:hypothetical protein
MAYLTDNTTSEITKHGWKGADMKTSSKLLRLNSS